MYNQKELSVTTIAFCFGVSPNKVRGWMRQYGIKRRVSGWMSEYVWRKNDGHENAAHNVPAAV